MNNLANECFILAYITKIYGMMIISYLNLKFALMEVFIRPTPNNLLIIAFIYAVLVSVLGYFLSGWWIALMGAVGSLQMLGSLYRLSKTDKLRDKHKTQKEWFIYFSTPLVMIWFLGINQGAFFRNDFVTDKRQLASVTGIIPAQSTQKQTGGKSRRTYYYVTINHINLHCSESDYDDCERVYAHKGNTATVYYQANTKNGNLAYEIVVGNMPIYQFDKQLADFKQKRQQENYQYFWAFVLYFLPAFYFVFAHRQAVAYIDEMDENEKIKHDLNNELELLKNERISAKDYGMFGFILYWIGLLCIAISILTFIVFLIKKTFMVFLIFLILAMLGGVFAYFPYQAAKENYNERIAKKQGELNERYIELNPISMIATDSAPRFPNPNRVVFPKNTNAQTTINHDTNNQEYEDDEDEKIERVSFSDFGWLNLFVLAVGVMTLSISIYLLFDKTIEKNKIYHIVNTMFICGSLIMIYKPIAIARLNRDIRMDLYEMVWIDDEDDEPTLFYRVFRLLMLIILIPLFLWLAYGAVVYLFNGHLFLIVGSLFFLVVVGYGIKKLW